MPPSEKKPGFSFLSQKKPTSKPHQKNIFISFSISRLRGRWVCGGGGVMDIKWNNPKAHHSTQYIFTLTTWNFNITTVVCSNSVLKCYHKWIPYLNNLLVLIRNHVIIKHFFRNMFSLCCLRHAFDKTRSIAVLLGDLLTSWRTNWAKTPTAQYLFIIKEPCWLFSILSRVNWTRSLLEI